jgi:hypothetical protein
VAQIEVLEQVECLRLRSVEIVPLILPPEAVEAGVEIFPRQVALIADALDVVVRLQGMPKGTQMLTPGRRRWRDRLVRAERHAPLGVFALLLL